MKIRITKFMIFLVILFTTTAIQAQTTAFSYQGHLNNAGTPANGNYEMQFKLFDALSGGAQIGNTVTNLNVAVINGSFASVLDFGAAAFAGGPARYLEISVRPAGNPNPFTLLDPRQTIYSTPYSIHAKNAVTADSATNALQLGGINASQYLQTNGNGSGLTNLNAGNVTTGTLNSARLGQIPTANIADSAVTSAKIASGQVVKGVTVGVSTFTDNVTLAQGNNITITPLGNNTLTIASTAGGEAILNQTTQQPNSNFNISGNGIVGNSVGVGTFNPVTKLDVRGHLTIDAGGDPIIYTSVSSGEQNRYLSLINSAVTQSASGLKAGGILVADSFGYADPGKNDLIVKGKISIGTPFPGGRFTVYGTNVSGEGCGPAVIGWGSPVIAGCGTALSVTTNDTSINLIEGLNSTGSVFQVNGLGNVGIRGTPLRTLHVYGRARIGSIPQEPSFATVCFNQAGDLLQCGGSSLRWKTNMQPFRSGLDVVKRLQPISFNWKEDGRTDFGLSAEDVAKVAPDLAIENSEGVISGVKYDRLNILLINAIKEQQALIEEQKKLNRAQQDQINRLTGRLRRVERQLRKKGSSRNR